MARSIVKYLGMLLMHTELHYTLGILNASYTAISNVYIHYDLFFFKISQIITKFGYDFKKEKGLLYKPKIVILLYLDFKETHQKYEYIFIYFFHKMSHGTKKNLTML